MTQDVSAPSLLRSVGLMADGPAVWGRPVQAQGPGVFVVEAPAPLPSAPIELTRVGKWIERVDGLRLDGEVELQFVIQFLFHAAAEEYGPQPKL